MSAKGITRGFFLCYYYIALIIGIPAVCSSISHPVEAVVPVALIASGLLALRGYTALLPREPDPDRCPKCQYSLVGLRSDICTECGCRVDLNPALRAISSRYRAP